MNQKLSLSLHLLNNHKSFEGGLFVQKQRQREKKRILQQILQQKTILTSDSSLLKNQASTGGCKSFIWLNEIFFSQVQFDDSKHVMIEGQGVVSVHIGGGKKRRIHSIYYSLKINYTQSFECWTNDEEWLQTDDQCKIIDKKNLKKSIFVKMKTNYLFSFDTLKL